MKKSLTAIFVSIIISMCVIFSVSPAHLCAADRENQLPRLLDGRSSLCWVEGELFGGDMIIGARGSIRFICLDAKLSDAIRNDRSLPSWMDDSNQLFGTQMANKKVVFIAEIEANKPWEFEYGKIFVGGYNLTKEDILTHDWPPIVEIPSRDTGRLIFAVPVQEVPRGKEITLGYGDYSVKWKVPR